MAPKTFLSHILVSSEIRKDIQNSADIIGGWSTQKALYV
ncbi:hypothetical protein Q7O_001428 [Pectobacterium carotovorum subsp. carotovorum PCCS1]|nr:hypothetical protein [Pectobacterium carotovorum subsp. carotovorum PCCS1]